MPSCGAWLSFGRCSGASWVYVARAVSPGGSSGASVFSVWLRDYVVRGFVLEVRGATMSSLRCTQCDIRYPVRNEFFKCPGCGIQTGRYAKEPTLDESEVNHALFSAYLRRTGRLLAEEAA